ncbi:MAG: hypothetical protein ACRDFY_01930 [Candidatus Limnocylindria bacterium]
MTALLPILIAIALVVALDLVALRFGADSRDRFGASSRDVLR